MAQKRKSSYDTEDGFVIDDNAVKSTKKAKTTSTSSSYFSKASETQKDSNGDTYWEISKARRVTISEFKGKKMVSVREYYEKDDEWLPGKKGISMTVEQFSSLIELLPSIETELKKAGVEDLPRPIYSDQAGPSRTHGAEEAEDEEESRRANHEATSDEEE